MPVEVIVQTIGATALLLLGAEYFFSGGAPALVTGAAGEDKPKKERPAWLDTLMFLGGGGGDDGSDEIRRQEEERQRKVRQSTERINRIFDQFNGIEYQAVNPIAGMSQDAYNQAVKAALDGNVDAWSREQEYTYIPMGRADGKGQEKRTRTITGETLNSAGRRALQELGLTNAQIDQAGTSLTGYQNLYQQALNNTGNFQKVNTGNSLFDQYRQDYMSYYQPQLENQYTDARTDVMYDLARRGATESSAGQRRLSDLLEEYNNQQTQLNSRATNAVNDYRSSVEQQRQSLISQAQAGMAPTDAANLASNAYNSLKSQTPQYDALGDVFNQFADVYGLQLRAQGAGFGNNNVSSASGGGLPGQSGTSKIRG